METIHLKELPKSEVSGFDGECSVKFGHIQLNNSERLEFMKTNELKTSILIPVVRPENVKPLIRAIHKNAGVPANMYEILTLEDTEREGCPKTLHKLVEKAKGDCLCFLGDDTLPEKNFLSTALMYMHNFPDGKGLVALNDGSGRPETASHFVIHREMCDYLEDGQLFHISYGHCYGDNELSEIMQGLDCYAFANEARIKHNHPIHGTADYDEHYQRAYEDETFRHDQKNFLERKIKRGQMHLGICLPTTNERDYNAFWVSFAKMLKPSYWTLFIPKFGTGEGNFKGDIIDVRNNLVKQALMWRVNCTHLLFMDTDQMYPQNLIPRLVSHNKPFVGTVVHRRYPPFDPCVRVAREPGKPETYDLPESVYDGGLIKADVTGFGCFMVQTPLLFEMEHKPGEWFKRDKTRDNGHPVGEDYEFCERLREHGGQVWVDTLMEIEHLTTVAINRDYHEIFMALHRKRIESLKHKKVLGQGTWVSKEERNTI